MRRSGASRAAIARALGVRDNGTLSAWLEGVSVPLGVRSRHRYDASVRVRAMEMRREGRSYREITESLSVPKSTLSTWLKDVALTGEQRRLLREQTPDAGRRRSIARRARRIAETERILSDARAAIGPITDRELFLAGIVAYWAEGAKSKPWRRDERVTFINSDPSMIRIFLAWVRRLGFTNDDLIFRVSIHEDADIEGAERSWAELVGVPAKRFERTTLKRHNPSSSRRNRGEGYVGCLTIVVRRSTELYRHISGWYDGIVASLGP